MTLQWEWNSLTSTSDKCTFHLYARTCLALLSHVAWCTTLPISSVGQTRKKWLKSNSNSSS